MKIKQKKIKISVDGTSQVKLDVNGRKLTKEATEKRKQNRRNEMNFDLNAIQKKIETMEGQFNRNKDKVDSLKNIEQRKELDKRIIQLQKEKEQVRSTALREIADI